MCGLPRRCGVVRFLLLAADVVASAPQVEKKVGAPEWLAFGIIVSLGLFICWHLFYDSDVPPFDDDEPSSTAPDHEFWI